VEDRSFPAGSYQPSQEGGMLGGKYWPAILNAGLGMMAQSGWTRIPVSTAEAIGKGGLVGTDTYMQLRKQYANESLAQEQIAAMRQQREAQAQLLQERIKEQRRQAALLDGLSRAQTIPQAIQIMRALYPEKFTEAMLKSQEPYTLPEGGRRFAGGEQIAENAKPGDFEKFAQDTGLVAGTPEYNKAKADWIVKKTQFAPPTAVMNVNTQSTASEEAQKELMKEVRANYNTLRSAPALLDNIEKAKALIPRAGPMVGMFSEAKKNVAKFFNNTFGTDIAVDQIGSAEELQTRLFQQIMENLKKMDAQPSQMQQMIMMQSLGNLTSDPSALPRILDVMQDIVRQKVDLHNRDVTTSMERGIKYPYDPLITLPERKATPSAEPTGGTGMQPNETLEEYKRRRGLK
jgi:hypothetical protein